MKIQMPNREREECLRPILQHAALPLALVAATYRVSVHGSHDHLLARFASHSPYKYGGK